MRNSWKNISIMSNSSNPRQAWVVKELEKLFAEWAVWPK